MDENQAETVSAKITAVTYREMKKIIEKRGYMNESEFIRQSIVEKIDREKQ
jgi:Arc/MetJ-type ribon-helix-helix transcriptional regulator